MISRFYVFYANFSTLSLNFSTKFLNHKIFIYIHIYFDKRKSIKKNSESINSRLVVRNKEKLSFLKTFLTISALKNTTLVISISAIDIQIDIAMKGWKSIKMANTILVPIQDKVKILSIISLFFKYVCFEV